MKKILKQTMVLRIRREIDYVGRDEIKTNIDTLQQLFDGVDENGKYFSE